MAREKEIGWWLMGSVLQIYLSRWKIGQAESSSATRGMRILEKNPKKRAVFGMDQLGEMN
jgi:hypothetical protein